MRFCTVELTVRHLCLKAFVAMGVTNNPRAGSARFGDFLQGDTHVRQSRAHRFDRGRIRGAAQAPHPRDANFWDDCCIRPFACVHLLTLAQVKGQQHDLRKNVDRGASPSGRTDLFDRCGRCIVFGAPGHHPEHHLGEGLPERQSTCCGSGCCASRSQEIDSSVSTKEPRSLISVLFSSRRRHPVHA